MSKASIEATVIMANGVCVAVATTSPSGETGYVGGLPQMSAHFPARWQPDRIGGISAVFGGVLISVVPVRDVLSCLVNGVIRGAQCDIRFMARSCADVGAKLREVLL